MSTRRTALLGTGMIGGGMARNIAKAGIPLIASSVKALGSKNTRTATTDALLNEIGR